MPSTRALGYPHWDLHFSSDSFQLSLALPQNHTPAGEYFIPRHGWPMQRTKMTHIELPGHRHCTVGSLVIFRWYFQEPDGEPTGKESCLPVSLVEGRKKRYRSIRAFQDVLVLLRVAEHQCGWGNLQRV